MNGLFIFRKDLRIDDNNALNNLLEICDNVYCVFIYDINQLNSNHSSINSLFYLSQCVSELNKQLDNKLIVMNGDVQKCVTKIISTTNINYIAFNADFTNYSRVRDNMIIELCKDKHINTIINYDDMTTIPMMNLLKGDNSIYVSFGGFKKNLSDKTNKINPITYTNLKYKIKKLKLDNFVFKLDKPKNIKIVPYKREDVIKEIIEYKEIDRDELITETSLLSTALNFGVVSIREAWVLNNDLRRNLIWRSYFTCILRFNNSKNNYTNHFIDSKYNSIKWPKININHWNAFVNCKTGFLLIDAIHKELQTTGYINNRARLLLATFWIKYLLVSPYDTKYGSIIGYSKLLIDCSTSQNNYNHEWVLGSLDLSGRRFAKKGTNPLTGRLIRIDNEMIKKYDKQCYYIKKWLPHLTDVKISDLVKWGTKDNNIHPNPLFDWKLKYDEYVLLFI